MFGQSRYHLRSVSGGEITLARARDVSAKEREAAVPDAVLRAALLDALDDGATCRSLAAFLDGIGMGRYTGLAADRSRLVAAVDAARSARALVAYETPRRRVIMHVDEPGDVLGPEAEPTSWIEVLLVDDDGQPIVNEPYVIEDPAGRIWQGTTNLSGMTRIEGIDPGSCKISFPSIPAQDWKRAG